MLRKALALFGALFFVALVAPSSALADSTTDVFDRAASVLQRDPVYIAPDSDAQISEDELDKLSAQIKEYGIPVYIAILPESAIEAAGGDVDDVPTAVTQALGRVGVYAAVAGHNFRANSNGALPSGRTGDIANSSFDNNNPGDNDGEIYPLLSDFVTNVDYAFHPEDKPKTNWGLIGEVFGIVVGSILAIALFLWGLTSFLRRRREERERAEAFASRKAKAEAAYARQLDEVTSLGNSSDPVATEQALAAGAALSRADQLIGTAKTEEDLANAEDELYSARQAASQAKAQVDKRRGVESFLKRTQKRVSSLDANAAGNAATCRDAALKFVATAESSVATDLDSAQRSLEKADTYAADCEAYLAGRDPVQEREDAERERQRVAAERAEAERLAAEKRREEEAARQKLAASVKPAKFKPRQSRTATHSHHYDGGFYRGRYFGPGYYTDPFWTWVAMDAVLDSSRSYDHGGSYDNSPPPVHHSSSHHSDSYSSSSSSHSGSDFSGGGSWGGGGSFGGGGGGGGSDSSGGGSW